MQGKTKVLGLVLVAAMALSGIVASGASATAAHFQAGAGEGTTTITMETDPSSPGEIFETDVGPLECQEISGDYSGPATTADATFTGIEYSGECNTAGLESEVKFNGCDYEFHAGTKTAAGSEGTADLECPEGQEVEIIAAGGLCTLSFPAQNGLGPVKYTNVKTTSKKEEITVHTEVQNTEYGWSGPLCGQGEDNNGTLTGTLTWRAETTAPGLLPLDLTVVST